MVWARQVFSGRPLRDYFESLFDEIKSEIDSLPDSQLLNADKGDILDYIESKFHVDPIILHEDKISRDEHEIPIDVSEDPQRHIRDRSTPLMIPGGLAYIYIPFEGDQKLLDYTPAIGVFQGSLPKMGVQRDSDDSAPMLVFAYGVPVDKLDDFLKQDVYKKHMNTLRSYVSAARDQVSEFNKGIKSFASDILSGRIQRRKKIADAFSSMGIPLRARPGSPDYRRIELKQRIVKPLPTLNKSEPEYGISDDTYETILALIRHSGRSFETTPLTFAKFEEEELRDIILAFLNGLFEGGATGESFRKKGKADIFVKENDRAAFIGECKIWGGDEVLRKTINQQLGYQIWRDTKGTIILFNKTRSGFSELQKKLPKTFRAHPLYLKEMKAGQAGEWRFRMRSDDDPEREITVHVFLFNLYTKAKP